MTFMNASPITVDDFIVDLERRGVTLRLDAAGELEVVAPAGTLTDRDRRLLVLLKPSVIAAVRAGDLDAGTDIDDRADGDRAAADDALTGTCTAAGCTGELDAYDEHGRAWCARHRPDPGPIEPTPEPPPWRCRCGGEVSGRLPRCPTCLRQSDGRPSSCAVCGADVVRRPPPPQDVGLRTPWGEEPSTCGPQLEPFCPQHRRGAHVLWVAQARGWPAFRTSDGTSIGEGKPAWLQAVRTHGDDRWYTRVLVELGSTPPVPEAAPLTGPCRWWGSGWPGSGGVERHREGRAHGTGRREGGG
jgi:hypothetical protein